MREKLREWFRPQLTTLFSKFRRPKPLHKLYIVEPNFKLTPEFAESLAKSFEDLGKKHGISFFILEPGFKLRRFDDI